MRSFLFDFPSPLFFGEVAGYISMLLLLFNKIIIQRNDNDNFSAPQMIFFFLLSGIFFIYTARDSIKNIIQNLSMRGNKRRKDSILRLYFIPLQLS